MESFWNKTIMNKAASECTTEPFWTNSYNDSINSLLKYDCDYIFSDEMTARAATSRKYCNKLVIVGEPAIQNGMSFVLPHSAPSVLMNELNRATYQLRDEGKLLSAEGYLRNEEGTCNFDYTSSSLNFEKMISFFISAYGACVVVFLLMIFNLYRWQQQNPNQPMTNHDAHESETPA